MKCNEIDPNCLLTDDSKFEKFVKEHKKDIDWGKVIGRNLLTLKYFKKYFDRLSDRNISDFLTTSNQETIEKTLTYIWHKKNINFGIMVNAYAMRTIINQISEEFYIDNINKFKLKSNYFDKKDQFSFSHMKHYLLYFKYADDVAMTNKHSKNNMRTFMNLDILIVDKYSVIEYMFCKKNEWYHEVLNLSQSFLDYYIDDYYNFTNYITNENNDLNLDLVHEVLLHHDHYRKIIKNYFNYYDRFSHISHGRTWLLLLALDNVKYFDMRFEYFTDIFKNWSKLRQFKKHKKTLLKNKGEK